MITFNKFKENIREFLVEDFKTVTKKFLDAGATSQEVEDYIQRFRVLNNSQRLQGDEKNIDNWGKKSFDEFKQFIETRESELSKTAKIKKERSKLGERIDLTKELGLEGWNIYIPLDKAAACYKTDKATDWCVAKRDQNYFEDYIYEPRRKTRSDQTSFLIYCLRNEPQAYWAIIVHVNKYGSKLNEYSYEYDIYTAKDVAINSLSFKRSSKLNADQIINFAMTKLNQIETGIDTAKDKTIKYQILRLKGGQINPELEKRILETGTIDDAELYEARTGKRIKFAHRLYLNSGEDAYRFYLDNFRWKAWSDPRIMKKFGITADEAKKAELAISEIFFSAYDYAYNTKKRMPGIERRIMQRPYDAAEYAAVVLRKRWPEAEPYILKSADAISKYTREVIKGRWPEAERVLSKNAYEALNYAFTIKDRFPAGEPVIAKNTVYALRYAIHILDGVWIDPKFNIKKSVAELAHRNITDINQHSRMRNSFLDTDHSLNRALKLYMSLLKTFKETNNV